MKPQHPISLRTPWVILAPTASKPARLGYLSDKMTRDRPYEYLVHLCDRSGVVWSGKTERIAAGHILAAFTECPTHAEFTEALGPSRPVARRVRRSHQARPALPDVPFLLVPVRTTEDMIYGLG